MAKSVKFILITITIILIYLFTPALSVNTQPADFESWRDKTIEWATNHINYITWSGNCMKFVACAFQQSEKGYAGGNADEMAKKLPLFDGNLNPDVLDRTPGGWDNIPKGAIIFFAGTPANKIGHVGIHIGNGWIIHAFGRVMTTQISKATSLTDKGKLVVGSYMGWSYPPESWRPATQPNSIGASAANPAVEKLNQVTLTLYVHKGNRNGPVIPGAQVTGQDGSGNSFQQTTDNSGYVTIKGDPGTWSFIGSADGYETKSWTQPITETDTKDAFLLKKQQEIIPVTLTLYFHNGDLNGPVIPGAQVTGQDGSGNSFQQTTDSNGYVKITGDPGTWSFSASADGYETYSEDQEIIETGTKAAFLLKKKQEIIPVTLTLYVHDGSASGPIIPGAQVTGQDGSGNSFQQTTDSSGYVKITGDPGTWSFSASADGYETYSEDQEISETGTKAAFLLKKQQEIISVTLTLYVHDGSAKGPIIPGARITGQDGSGNSFQQTTDSNGYVKITGDTGTWSFSASADGYETNSWDQEITKFCTKHAFLQEVQQQKPTEGSVVGKWNNHWTVEMPYDAGPDSSGRAGMSFYGDDIFMFYSDGTFKDVPISNPGAVQEAAERGQEDLKAHNIRPWNEESTGRWTQQGDTVRMQYDDGRVTECTINGDTMSAEIKKYIGDNMRTNMAADDDHFMSYSYVHWSASRVDT